MAFQLLFGGVESPTQATEDSQISDLLSNNQSSSHQTDTTVNIIRKSRRKTTEHVDFFSGTGYAKEKDPGSDRHVKKIQCRKFQGV